MFTLSDIHGINQVSTDRRFAVQGVVYCQKLVGNFLYIGGSFTGVKKFTDSNYTSRQNIAKIDITTGQVDTTFDTSSGATGGIVYCIETDSNGDMYLGGSFSTYKGITRQGIVKIDPITAAVNTTFNSSNGFTVGASTGTVYGIAVDSTSVYCGGIFTAYAGTSRYYIAKLNRTTAALDGTFNTAFGANEPDSLVQTIIQNGSGALYIGGGFTSINLNGVAQTRQRVAKISASTAAVDGTFNSSSGFNARVYGLILEGSSLYCSGDFITYGATGRQRVAKLNASTAALDSTFDTTSGINRDTGTPSVRTLLLDGNNLYLFGYFNSYKGTSAVGAVKINKNDASHISTFDTQSTATAVITYSASQTTNNIITCGSFSSYRTISDFSNAMVLNKTDGRCIREAP